MILTFMAGSLLWFMGSGKVTQAFEAKEEETENVSAEGMEEIQGPAPTCVQMSSVDLFCFQVSLKERHSALADLWASWEPAKEEEEIEIPEILVAPVNDKEDPEKNKAKEEADKGTSEEISIKDMIQDDSQGTDSSQETKDPGSQGGSQEGQGVSYGIDVSKYQKNIDWAKVAESGVEFAIIRCGYRGSETGKIVMDPYFKKNISGALSNGIAVGVYFYSQSIDEGEARQEAAWVAEVIKGYDITYPVVFDYEGIGENRIKDVTKTQRTNNALAFMDQIRKAGYTPMMYASKNGYRNNWETSRFTNCKIWLAHYTSGGKPSDYTGHYDMWQYTSKGKVPGIDGYTDMDIAYFKYSNQNSGGKVSEVTCQVEDGDGSPLAGVTVTLSGGLTYAAVTGEDGIARFPDVRLDSYKVETTQAPEGYILEEKAEKEVVIGKAQASFSVGVLSIQLAPKPSLEEGEEEVAGIIVKAGSGYVVTTGNVNIRSLPTTDGEKYGVAALGTVLEYTGICDNGWYRVIFKGNIGYVSGNYAVPYEMPEEPSEEESSQAPETEETASLGAERGSGEEASSGERTAN